MWICNLNASRSNVSIWARIYSTTITRVVAVLACGVMVYISQRQVQGRSLLVAGLMLLWLLADVALTVFVDYNRNELICRRYTASILSISRMLTPPQASPGTVLVLQYNNLRLMPPHLCVYGSLGIRTPHMGGLESQPPNPVPFVSLSECCDFALLRLFLRLLLLGVSLPSNQLLTLRSLTHS